MRAVDIIQKARYSLNDTQSGSMRWTDSRLLSLLNDALIDIASTTSLYYETAYVELVKDISVYDMSRYILKIDRVEHMSIPLSMKTFDEMDSLSGGKWQEETSNTPRILVYNLTNMGNFRLYPIPSLGTDQFLTSSDFGIITDVRYEDLQIKLTTSNEGGMSEPDLSKYIKIYYTKIPEVVSYVSYELESVISPTMISMLANFVTSGALQDNSDAKDRKTANEQYALYEDKKSSLSIRKSFNGVSKLRSTAYNPMG